jgi:Uncharacterized protein conserved in bacteria
LSKISLRVSLVAILALIALAALAAAADYPETLPPPPELMEAGDTPPTAEEIRDALTPPPVVVAQPQPAAQSYTTTAEPADNPYEPRVVYTAPDPVDPTYIPQTTQPAPTATAPVFVPVSRGYSGSGIVISAPSSSMPVDYFELPVDDGGTMIPGVLIPEMEDDFYAPTPARIEPPRTGLSVRQLEPFFALAKGTEGQALEARRTGNDAAYYEMLRKSIDAYMHIVTSADAGGEAREEAWYGIARCEYRMANWWRAFQALERSFPEEYNPGEVAGRMKLESFIGERLWRMGDTPVQDARDKNMPLNGYQSAARVYAAMVENVPAHDDTPLALLRQGDAASLINDWDNAARYYRQLVEYFPDSEEAMQGRSSLTEAIYRQEWPRGFPEAARDDVQNIMGDVVRADSGLSAEALDRRRRAEEVANDLDADIKLRHAKEYLKSVKLRKSREGAVFLLQEIVRMYPRTEQAAEAGDLLLSLGVTPEAPVDPVGHTPFVPQTYPPEPEFDPYGTPSGYADTDSYVTFDIPTDIPAMGLPASPTRETVYQSLPDPVPVQ